jgi:hypothetical protein
MCDFRSGKTMVGRKGAPIEIDELIGEWRSAPLDLLGTMAGSPASSRVPAERALARESRQLL